MMLPCLMFIFAFIAIEGLEGKPASDICLDCLKRHKPIAGCITYPENTYCGPYRISSVYFADCRAGVSNGDFKSCTLDEVCARSCVEEYQTKNAHICLDRRKLLKGDDYDSLSCADYGRMHYGGISACGMEDTDEIQHYLSNLTSLCGCLTVYEECTFTTTTQAKSDERLVVYIVPPICGVVIIVAVVFCVIYLRGYHLRRIQRRREEVLAEKNDRNLVVARTRDTESVPGDNRLSIINNYTVNSSPPPTLPERDLGRRPPLQDSLTMTMVISSNTKGELSNTPAGVRIPDALTKAGLSEVPTNAGISYAFPTKTGRIDTIAEAGYDAHYAQPIPYDETGDLEDNDSVADPDLPVVSATDSFPSSENPAIEFDDMYVNSGYAQPAEKTVGRIPSKTPKPAPRKQSEGGSVIIRYVSNPSLANEDDGDDNEDRGT